MEQICPHNKCFGCSVCAGICPTKAISMETRELGHIHPVINQNKCIDCKKCERTCPVNKEQPLQLPAHTYAAWSTDIEQHHTSTSGGISACLAELIIDKFGGVVYGCASLQEGRIEHIRVDNVESALAIKGSKYVQSHISRDTVQSIISDLKEGRKVLFLGTPCQVAAVKSIGQPYEDNLFCVDLICHGVPSQEFLFRYLDELGIKRHSINKISFREKLGCVLCVNYKGGTYRKAEYRDLYYMAFNENMSFRESCYTCQFSQKKRIGDITIGDFWGLGAKEPFNYNANGNISVVLANNKKGQDLLESLNIQKNIFLIPRLLEEAINGNHNLQKPSDCICHYKLLKSYNSPQLIPELKRLLIKRRIKGVLMPYVQMIIRFIYRFK